MDLGAEVIVAKKSLKMKMVANLHCRAAVHVPSVRRCFGRQCTTSRHACHCSYRWSCLCCARVVVRRGNSLCMPIMIEDGRRLAVHAARLPACATRRCFDHRCTAAICMRATTAMRSAAERGSTIPTKMHLCIPRSAPCNKGSPKENNKSRRGRGRLGRRRRGA
jgi:hypothetical protein